MTVTIFRRVMGILVSLALGAGLVAAILVSKAKAAPRCDAEAWICKSIRQQHRAEREREERREEARDERERAAIRYARERQRELEREREAAWRRNHDRYYGYRSADRHPETRVYGFVARMTQIDGRDCRNGCCPAVENISRSHTSEAEAWDDAQLGWMKAVSVRYGAMYADVQNMDIRTMSRQCFRCEFNESWIGRKREQVAQATGVSNGFKSCCRIIASPCIQPIQGANEAPLKGDERQQ